MTKLLEAAEKSMGKIFIFHMPKSYPLKPTVQMMFDCIDKFALEQKSNRGKTLNEIVLVERDIEKAQILIKEF